MVIDIFLFCKEFDILEIRLQELYDVVDKFILVEADHTFNDGMKPYYFKEFSQDRFDVFKDKILPIFIPHNYHKSLANINKKDNHWIERCDRFYAAEALKKIAKDEDIILLNDVDEIPSKTFIEKIKSQNLCKPLNIKMKLFRYYLNLYFQDWKCTSIMNYKYFKECNEDWDFIRRKLHYKFPITVGTNGWHFSHIGTPEDILEKMRCNVAYKEVKRGGWDSLTKVKYLVKSHYHRKYVNNEDKKGKFVKIEELPLYIQNNSYKFQKLLGLPSI